MEIVTAAQTDLPRILEVLEEGRKTMVKTGNPNQWQPGYPTAEMVLRDIDAKNFYLVKQRRKICGCFAFIVGEDPTYKKIEDGAWLNSSRYGTIHRIASDGSSKGVFEAALKFCETRCPHIRVDTHADNQVMQGLMAKYGFQYCGIIHIADGSPRLAYEKYPEQKGTD